MTSRYLEQVRYGRNSEQYSVLYGCMNSCLFVFSPLFGISINSAHCTLYTMIPLAPLISIVHDYYSYIRCVRGVWNDTKGYYLDITGNISAPCILLDPTTCPVTWLVPACLWGDSDINHVISLVLANSAWFIPNKFQFRQTRYWQKYYDLVVITNWGGIGNWHKLARMRISVISNLNRICLFCWILTPLILPES